MYDRWIEDVSDMEPSWSDLPESHKSRLAESARAAVILMLDPTSQMVRAATESVAEDGEGGEFAPLFDLLDFSGENKTRLVVTQALKASAAAILNEKPILQGEA